MRRIATIALLSLLLVSFTVPVYADKDKDHRRERYEHRNFSFLNKKHHDKDKHYKKEKHHDKDRKHKGHDKYDKHKYDKHHKYDYRKPKHYKHKYHDRGRHYGHSYSKQLERMVRYAARGARDVDVWEISPDVYMVRYYLNGHYYAQRLYPSSGRYGARGLINVNWAPSPGWSLLPSININIPIN